MRDDIVATARDRGVARWLGAVADVLRVAERFGAPFTELLARLWLGQAFLVSGIVKAADWDAALYLARHEYPVSWLDPAAAAWIGAGIELVAASLLAVGLATRIAAAAMLALAVVVQTHYVALDQALVQVALLAWFIAHGGGTLSLDRLVAPGLARSPLPLAQPIARLVGRFHALAPPACLLALRAWVAVTLGAGVLWPAGVPAALSTWLPTASVAAVPPLLAGVAAVLLLPGVATRAVAVLLLAGHGVAAPMDAAATARMYWLLLYVLLALRGAGALSLDALLLSWLRRRFPELAGRPAFSLDGLPRVVIVGAGFGGLTCAARLRRTPVSITLIDRHNYHLFQPLLYQVATAALSPGDIAVPVRGLFREQFNARVLFGEVTAVDPQRRHVVAGHFVVPYDYLVLATGASHSYFGKDAWGAYAPGLKRIEDATEVRRRLLTAFELAEATEDPAERSALTTFLVVGGGPTGVELAGAIAELARFGMQQDFRHLDPASARVLLVQSAPRLLPAFPETLGEHARTSLEALGVEVLLGQRVDDIDARGVTVGGTRIAARTVLWAAGVVASPAARWLGAAADGAGRVRVGGDLSVSGHAGVYAIGDTAVVDAWDGAPVPGLAPAAKQAGAYVAGVIRARVLGRPPPPPFAYRHLGSLATIGRKAAVADFGGFSLSGATAWWLWGLIHVGFLVGLRNRVSVMLDWMWAYLTLRSGTRLITGAPPPDVGAAARVGAAPGDGTAAAGRM
jgi:NADH dehydrogenase/putative oxidoreductase